MHGMTPFKEVPKVRYQLEEKFSTLNIKSTKVRVEFKHKFAVDLVN